MIKSDRSFIRGSDVPDGEYLPIVRAVVELADSLGMITTAEGAETPEEIHALRNIGCTQVQGFAYGKPMSYEAASALVARSEEHTSELQSLMRTSYAVFCLKKKKK